MILLVYLFLFSFTGLLILFAAQAYQFRAGKIDSLPNVSFKDVVAPVCAFGVRWLSIWREHAEAFFIPIIIFFYRALLRLLHRATLRIAVRLQHLADVIMRGQGGRSG